MPYRVDIPNPPRDALDTLVQWGALDVEQVGSGIAAILPDAVAKKEALGAFGEAKFSEALARDNGSVWLLKSPTVIVRGRPLSMLDADAFGTGSHPTTALCLEAMEEIVAAAPVEAMLDVGTGSGILALAALLMGVPHATGVDIDRDALHAAAENGRLNGLSDRLDLSWGGPEAVSGTWPLVAANILTGPLIEMAPRLVRTVEKGGWLVLSGISAALDAEVRRPYRDAGMHHVSQSSRNGWSALIFRTSW